MEISFTSNGAYAQVGNDLMNLVWWSARGGKSWTLAGSIFNLDLLGGGFANNPNCKSKN